MQHLLPLLLLWLLWLPALLLALHLHQRLYRRLRRHLLRRALPLLLRRRRQLRLLYPQHPWHLQYPPRLPLLLLLRRHPYLPRL